ncbi:hypothetical protein Ancab_000915 [Ancistrocladus abbreviatus]
MQINEFEGGGVAIGLSCTHLMADPTCATLILKAWTEAHHQEAIAHPPFVHPPALHSRSTANSNARSANYYASKAKRETPAVKMATATFTLFWARIIQIKAAKQDHKQSLSVCIDFRKRMHAPLPYGYFGNALHFSQLTVDTKELEGSDLDRLVELVQSHVSGLEEEELWSAIDWLHSTKDEKGKFAPPFRMYGPELTCVNMEHMIAPIGTGSTSRPLMYMAMFEKDVKPDHVSYRMGNVEGEGLILVMPSPEEGLARRVMVTLPKEQMTRLCEDQVMLGLKPTLLLSRR